MIAAILVSLASLTLSAPNTGPMRKWQKNLPATRLAFFEFAPASGAGMGAACACTTPTGAKGEAMTFTRASSATCTKTAAGGHATTGIADGDLVTCSSNQPRVEYGAAGVLGLRVESSRTNSALRSGEFNNAAWLSYTVGVPAITITPDVAVSPSGTLTADRLQIPATTTGQVSSIYQTIGTGERSVSVYAKGNGQSGSFQIVGFGGTCVTCNYNPTTWTRCGGVVAPAGSNFGFANSSHALECSGDTTPKSAVDVFLWGAQAEVGAYVTSYIPTTSAAVTTAAEAPYLTLNAPAPALNGIEATVDTPASFVANARVMTVYKDGANQVEMYVRTSFSNTLGCFYYVGGSVYEGASVLAVPASTSGVRLSCSYDGTNVIACVNGACNSTAHSFSMFSDAIRIYVGAYVSTGYELNTSPVIHSVRADPSPTRFR